MRFVQIPVVSTLVALCMTFSMDISASSAQTRAEKAEAEWRRLDEMQKSMAAPEYVGRNVDADLDTLRNLAKYREHLANLEKDFAAEIKENQQPFRNLGIGIRFLRDRIEGFEKAARLFGSQELVSEDLAHVLRMAKMGVENKAPAFFKPENDIFLRTEAAKSRLRYLEVLEPDSKAAISAKQEINDTATKVAQMQASLASEILAQNSLPPDEYRAADRDTLIKLLNEKWAKEGTKSEVLKTGIVTAQWTRSVSWEWQNATLYKVDKSRIQGYVIVKHDAKTAVRHSINLVKDHLSSDKITLTFLNDPKAAPGLINQILLSKVK